MTQDRRLPAGLVLGGLVGLVASAVLLIERIRVGEDSDYVPTCSINPVISCGSIMESAQASLLGFPNPIIGVAAFPVVVATGAALLGAAIGRAALTAWGGGTAPLPPWPERAVPPTASTTSVKTSPVGERQKAESDGAALLSARIGA